MSTRIVTPELLHARINAPVPKPEDVLGPDSEKLSPELREQLMLDARRAAVADTVATLDPKLDAMVGAGLVSSYSYDYAVDRPLVAVFTDSDSRIEATRTLRAMDEISAVKRLNPNTIIWG